jgi:diguanylate cyclase (GGDEF)-like protein
MVALADYWTSKLKKSEDLILVERKSFLRIRESSFRDPLTGLHNRRSLNDYLQKEFDKAKRYPIAFSILFLDIDCFKNLNDQYGHEFGDEVLQSVAKVIESNARDSDFIARFGGEEFVIVMSQTLGRMALDVAERLRKKIANLEIKVSRSEKPIQVTVSGGIATCPADSKEAAFLLRQADQALYLAKSTGRNRICHYRDTIYKPSRSRRSTDLSGSLVVSF